MNRCGVLGIVLAEPDVAAGPLQQHEGEVLRTHHRVTLADDVIGAQQLDSGRGRPLGFSRVVDRGRILALVADLGTGAVRRRDPRHQRLDRSLDHILHLGIKRTDRAAQYRLTGYDIVRGAAVELADADHGRVERPDTPADHRLQLGQDLRADHHRIDRQFRPGRMTAAPPDR